MKNPPLPIIRAPSLSREVPIISSIPHFGTLQIPEIGACDYSTQEFINLPWAYADIFAANVYGGAYKFGAHVLATPYSRLFVDVNRRRNDFNYENNSVTSMRGVFRTHTNKGCPIFRHEFSLQKAEYFLTHYYDPYHYKLKALVDKIVKKFGHALVLDLHTASRTRMGAHEIVIGSRGGKTAPREVIEQIIEHFKEKELKVDEDVPGYSGGYIVKTYGEGFGSQVHAVQIEINSGLLMELPPIDLFPRMLLGSRPKMHNKNVAKMREIIGNIIKSIRL